MSQIIVGYDNGEPIYADTSTVTWEDQTANSQALTASTLLVILQEIASKQVTGVAASEASATLTLPTTDSTSTFPTTATGDVDDDLYTLWVMLASIQQGGATPADINNMIEYIGSMYEMGDFDNDSLISQFFSSDYGTTLQTALADAVMLEYALQLMLSGADDVAISTAAYATQLIAELEEAGVPDTSAVITELTGWSNDTTYYLDSYGIAYDDDLGEWVLSANSMFNDSDNVIAIDSDNADQLVSALFYSETFADEDFASCTTYLYDELIGIAADQDMWNEPTTDFELAMEFIQLQLSGLASQQNWLTAESDVVEDLINTFNNSDVTVTTDVTYTEINGGQYTETTTTITGGEFGDISITYSTETGETTYTITPNEEGETAAMNFMTEVQDLYVNVMNNPLLGDDSTIKTDMQDVYDTIFNLPAIDSEGNEIDGETMGDAYAEGDSATVAQSLTYYQNTDAGTDVLDSLNTLTTDFTNESSTVQTEIAGLEKKYTGVMTAFSYYLMNVENTVNSQAVSNQTA